MLGLSPTLIAALVSLALGFGGGWTANGLRLGAEIAHMQAQEAIRLSNGLKDALDKTTQYQRTKDEALKKAESRATANAVSAALAGTESDKLRKQLDAAKSGIGNANDSSLRAHAATLNTVFRECQREYEEMGRHATRYASDSLTLQMSWPK